VLDGQDLATNRIDIQDDFTVVEWLELKRHRGATVVAAVEVEARDVLLTHLIVHDFDDPGFDVAGVRLSGFGNHSFTIRNGIIYDGDQWGIRGDELTDTFTVENCTIYGILGIGICLGGSGTTWTDSRVSASPGTWAPMSSAPPPRSPSAR
jgi:hypothetical protein